MGENILREKKWERKGKDKPKKTLNEPAEKQNFSATGQQQSERERIGEVDIQTLGIYIKERRRREKMRMNRINETRMYR